MPSGFKAYAWRLPAALKKLDRIVAMLADKPMTVYELADALPIARRTATVYLAFLRGVVPTDVGPPHRRVRIVAWRLLENGHHSAEYGLGAKPDKRQPKGRDVIQRRRDIRERLARTDPDELLRRRAARQLKRRGPMRDRMTAAFFGAARSDAAG